MAIGGAHDNYIERITAGQLDTHTVILLPSYTQNVAKTFQKLNPDDREDIVFPTSAASLLVSSSSANDNSTGTGARAVLLQGLDANYDRIKETVLLNGQTQVATTQQFLRINKIFVVSAGTNETNEGAVYVGAGSASSGVPSTIYSYASAGEGTSHIGSFTVARGFQLFVSNTHTSVGQTLKSDLFLRASSKPLDQAWITNIVGVVGGSHLQQLRPFFAIDEMTDFKIEAKTERKNAGVSNLITGYLRDKSLGA